MKNDDLTHYAPEDEHVIFCKPGLWVGGNYPTTKDVNKVTCPRCLAELYGTGQLKL